MPWRLALVVVAALVALAAPFAAGWVQTFLILALAKGLAVLGLLVLLQAGQVSFGHALYFAIGAYATAFLARALAGGEMVSLLALSAIIAGLGGLVIGLFVVRYRYIFFGMLNLAFSMVFYSILEKFFHLTGGSDGIRVPRPSVLGMTLGRDGFELTLYVVAILCAVLFGVLVHRYLKSPLGQALRAIKSNETRLEYIGVSARRVLLVAYVVSAVLCGLGGAITALAQGLATPEYAFWIRSGEFVFIAILGGAAHVAGAFVGALAFEGIRSFAAAIFADGWQMALGLMLIAVVLFASEGIAGLWVKLTGKSAPAKTEAAP